MNELAYRVALIALGSESAQARLRPIRSRPPAPTLSPTLVERITIRGNAPEANLEGNTVDRTVLVLPPPNYPRERNRRCPVVFALHGYSIGAEQWVEEIPVPQMPQAA